MPPMAIAAGIGGVSSILGSVLGSRQKTQTQTTTPTLTPQMQQMMDQLSAYSGGAMQNGGGDAVLKMKRTATDNVNRNYMKVGSRLNSAAAGRGYGSSGSLGNTQFNTEMSRAGDMSNLEGEFAKMGLDQNNFGATLGQNLLNFGKGSTTTGTMPGNMAGNGLMSAGNGLENIATMLMMSKILKGGTSGGGQQSAGGGWGGSGGGDFGYGGYNPLGH